MDSPLLSIGMIVKNEMRCIERCMKSLQPLREAIPCQLVIADTGSDDGTREVAEKYADLLFDFEWVNDFSAARNAVLDRCTGKWVLILDADECLDAHVAPLVEFLTGPDADQYSWGLVDSLHYGNFEMTGEGKDALLLRLARLDQHPRYGGTIHESFLNFRGDKAIALLDVKIHHDGYAKDPKHPEKLKEKMKRNMELLEKELAQDPKDLRRLLQCVESCHSYPAKLIDYVRRSMEALKERYQTAWGVVLGAVLCRYAIEVATAQQMPELDEWRDWAEEHYGDNMYLRLDGSFSLLRYYQQQGEYQKVPDLCRTFLKAWQDFKDQNFDVTILMYSTMRCSSRSFEIYARTAGCESLTRLGRPAEAATLLEGEPGWEDLKPSGLITLLIGGTWAAGEESLQDFIAEGADTVRSMTGGDAAGMWDAFRTAANSAFLRRDPDENAPKRPWRLFAKVKGGLGQSVRLMEGELPEVQEVLFQIKAADWEDVPAPAVARVVELGAELPDAFFTQSRERLAELATQISGALQPDALLDWTGRWDFTITMTRFQFLFDLLSAMMCRKEPWEEAEKEGTGAWRSGLCRRFLDVAADYLPNFYNSELLSNEPMWQAIPGLHRGALYLLQGQASREGGDELGYVRALRAALKAAPAMKKAVAFLQGRISEPPEISAPSPELISLAKQVRALLSQYPADDPVAAALKSSEQYQKMKYLIEDPDLDRL